VRLSSIARKGVKTAVLPFGLLGGRRPGDIVILLFHRVGAGHREIDLPVEVFEDQLDLLAEQKRVVTLEEALRAGGVVVTVDDGYRDFYDNVLPALARRRMPALLYLATGLVATRVGGNGGSIGWSQLEEAVDTGLVTVGSHTHTHANLSRATEREAEVEMLRSKELIEEHLDVACRHFAYPWGVASPAAERVSRRVFDSAALKWCTNRRDLMDRHRLGRTPVLRNDGRLFFRAKVNGQLDGEALVYRLVRRGPWRSA
jgi:peptidoglycan/xylan/chitin deacetylase (PgdA/CDA1 family)